MNRPGRTSHNHTAPVPGVAGYTAPDPRVCEFFFVLALAQHLEVSRSPKSSVVGGRDWYCPSRGQAVFFLPWRVYEESKTGQWEGRGGWSRTYRLVGQDVLDSELSVFLPKKSAPGVVQCHEKDSPPDANSFLPIFVHVKCNTSCTVSSFLSSLTNLTLTSASSSFFSAVDATAHHNVDTAVNTVGETLWCSSVCLGLSFHLLETCLFILRRFLN
jgi:hypothetical protein